MCRACAGINVPFKLPIRSRRGNSGRKHGIGRTPHLLAGTTAAVVGRLSRHMNGLGLGAGRRRGQALGHTYGERAVSAGKWQKLQVPPPLIDESAHNQAHCRLSYTAQAEPLTCWPEPPLLLLAVCRGTRTDWSGGFGAVAAKPWGSRTGSEQLARENGKQLQVLPPLFDERVDSQEQQLQ